jgi:hypothetical protein
LSIPIVFLGSSSKPHSRAVRVAGNGRVKWITNE